MKIEKSILLTVSFFFLISCGAGNGKDYTYEELQSYTDELTPLGTHFWKEFGDLRDRYNLTEAESKILGRWSGLGTNIARTFYFYPNGFFMVGFGRHRYKIEADKYLGQGYGTWEIRDNAVVVTVYMFRVSYRLPDTDLNDMTSEYLSISPYKASLINVNDVDSGGYTRKPFAYVDLPKELKSHIFIPSETKKKSVMVRSIYFIDPLVISDNKHYGYLSVVPDMAADNVSGLDIATNIDLAKKYFADFPF
jgi:hypothetical protein